MANPYPHRPHHGAPWDDQEKGLLYLRFELDDSLDELADAHGRTRCAIADQLEDQGLVVKLDSPEAAGMLFRVIRNTDGEIETLRRYASVRNPASLD